MVAATLGLPSPGQAESEACDRPFPAELQRRVPPSLSCLGVSAFANCAWEASVLNACSTTVRLKGWPATSCPSGTCDIDLPRGDEVRFRTPAPDIGCGERVVQKLPVEVEGATSVIELEFHGKCPAASPARKSLPAGALPESERGCSALHRPRQSSPGEPLVWLATLVCAARWLRRR